MSDETASTSPSTREEHPASSSTTEVSVSDPQPVAPPVNAGVVGAPVARPPSLASALATPSTAAAQSLSFSSSSASISRSAEFLQFRSSVGRQRVNVYGSVWTTYEYGPKDEPAVLFLHGTSGTAEIFFAQILSLSAKGYHVISASFPAYWSIDEWINGFDGFLKCLHLNSVHAFGWSLGGYLLLHYYTHSLKNSPSTCKISSLILCNAFLDTTPFHQSAGCLKMFPLAPEFVLKKIILDAFPQKSPFPAVVDFMVEQLDALSREDIAARLTLNCTKGRVYDLQLIDETKITVIDSNDDVVLPDYLRDQIYAAMPEAKQAIIKRGGDFPFLAAVDDVNLHIEVHLRRQGLLPIGRKSSESHANEPNSVSSAAVSGSNVVNSSSLSTSSSASTASVSSSFVPISAAIDLSRNFKEEDVLPTPIVLLSSSSPVVEDEEERVQRERQERLTAILDEEKKMQQRQKEELAAQIEEEKRKKAEEEKEKYKRHNELLAQLVGNEDAKPHVSNKNAPLF